MLEQAGAVRYYDKLVDCSGAGAASGTVTIPLAGVPIGNYTLKLFTEQANGDNLIDYASAPVPIALAVIVPSSAKDIIRFTISGQVGPAVITDSGTSTGSTIAVAANPNATLNFSTAPKPPSPLPTIVDGFSLDALIALLVVTLW